MNKRSSATLAGVLIVTAFGLGWSVGARSRQAPSDHSTNRAISASGDSDRLIHSRSARRLSAELPATVSIPVLNAESTATILRAIPFSELKATYLVRQDAEIKKIFERYPITDSSQSDYADVNARRSRNLMNALSEYHHFTSTADWTLRGGKRASVKGFVYFYGADSTAVVPLTELARTGGEICWLARVFFRLEGSVGDFTESTSSCLAGATYRNEVPFAILSIYISKQLIPYFDQLAIPLPSSDLEGDATPEWFDSGSSRWQGMAKLRWQGISKAAYTQLENEAYTDLATD